MDSVPELPRFGCKDGAHGSGASRSGEHPAPVLHGEGEPAAAEPRHGLGRTETGECRQEEIAAAGKLGGELTEAAHDIGEVASPPRSA